MTFDRTSARVFHLSQGLRAVAFGACMLSVLAPAQGVADTGIRFNDIVPDPGAGLAYERVPSATDAVLNEFKQQPLFFDFADPSTYPNIAQLPEETRGWPGVALFDYDGDGDLDLYVTNGPGANNSLFSNQLTQTGQLSFVDVGAQAGVGAVDQDSSGVCFGDIDNDGDHDLLVLGLAEPNRLFENQGNGVFNDISATAGVEGGALNSSSCALGDINGDGLLDIVVANSLPMNDTYAWWIEPFALNQHNQLYLNQGDNVFDDISESSGIEELKGFAPEFAGSAGVTWAIAMVDYDLDGDVDIVAAEDQVFTLPADVGGVDRGMLHIFRNDGTGHFTDVLIEANTDIPGAWMGLSFADLNSDGHMDMFASNGGDYAIGLFRSLIGLPYELGDFASRWFLGQGDGTFADPGVGEVIATTFAWGTSATDYNNDGDTDLIFYGAIDVIAMAMATNPGTILQNDGDAGFSYDAAAIAKDHSRRNVHGLAVGDLNQDGFVDIVSVASFDRPEPIPLVPMGIEYGGPFDAFANFVPTFVPDEELGALVWSGIVYPNGSLSVEMNSADNGNHWVEVSVTGSVGLTEAGRVNRDGIGAVVSFTPRGAKTVMQPVLGGSSHLSQDSLAQNFGLGEAKRGVVEVLWPGGVRNRLYGVKHGERIVFPEIPCSYAAEWDEVRDYRQCVQGALGELVDAGVLSRAERGRFLASAMRAFEDVREKESED